ncbi:MAG: ATP-binding cassette domain-containing protein, partial [Actinomycetota bacterium]
MRLLRRRRATLETRHSGPDRPAVECHALSKRFGDVVAVDNVSLEVPRGEILALLGPSGCGKTTFLRLVAGFEQPDAGEV